METGLDIVSINVPIDGLDSASVGDGASLVCSDLSFITQHTSVGGYRSSTINGVPSPQSRYMRSDIISVFIMPVNIKRESTKIVSVSWGSVTTPIRRICATMSLPHGSWDGTVVDESRLISVRNLPSEAISLASLTTRILLLVTNLS